MEEIFIYALPVEATELMVEDIPNKLFLSNGNKYTLKTLLYLLNKDLINTEKYWFRKI